LPILKAKTLKNVCHKPILEKGFTTTIIRGLDHQVVTAAQNSLQYTHGNCKGTWQRGGFSGFFA
jgi:hypothetical protein